MGPPAASFHRLALTTPAFELSRGASLDGDFETLAAFYGIRDVQGLKKKPSTSELLDWIKLLVSEDVDPRTLRDYGKTDTLPPLSGALLKNEQDVWLVRQSQMRRN